MLDQNIKMQITSYLALLESPIAFQANLHATENEKNMELISFLREVQACNPSKITLEDAPAARVPSFKIVADIRELEFCAIPLGHELTSFIMACLHVSGRAPKIDDNIKARIQALTHASHFTTYMSLGCHNCPDVVQALNIISVLNPKISHTTVDGALFEQEVSSKNVMAVPSVFVDDTIVFAGKQSLEEILVKLESFEASSSKAQSLPEEYYDVVIIGAGPAGVSSAIYSSRKGLKTAIVATRIGGQISDTIGIENFISQIYTEGPSLVKHLEAHLRSYPISVKAGTSVQSIEKIDPKTFKIVCSNQILKAKSIILATGAQWRNLNVPGEKEFKTKGVAYCPHCDGPFFKGKDVAVVGGGNSGVEAAIDLAAIVKSVVLVEYAPELKADKILQEKLSSYSNISVVKNAQTLQVLGDATVSALKYRDRESQVEHTITVSGIFVQIGLIPNTAWLPPEIARNNAGEIVVDEKGKTSVPGIFAAGDCTNVPYKQIVISMGEGAKAALGAFEFLTFNSN